MLIKYANDTKLDGIANTSEDQKEIENNHDRSEKWTESNTMKMDKDKCKVLHEGNNQIY